MKIKEIAVIIRPSPVKEYRAVDVRIRFDGKEREAHELLQDSDFTSRFDEMMEIIKEEVKRIVKEEEDEY